MASKFQQRHYEAIAEVFRQEHISITILADRDKDHEVRMEEWRLMRISFERLFETDNPRFKRERFIKAATWDKGVK